VKAAKAKAKKKKSKQATQKLKPTEKEHRWIWGLFRGNSEQLVLTSNERISFASQRKGKSFCLPPVVSLCFLFYTYLFLF